MSPVIFSILMLSSLWGTAVSSGLTLSLENKRWSPDGLGKKDVFACLNGCILLTPSTVPGSFCLYTVNMEHIHTGKKDIMACRWRAGWEQRVQKKKRLTRKDRNWGLFTETERVSEAALPPAPPDLIITSSCYFALSMQLLDTTCECSFIYPATGFHYRQRFIHTSNTKDQHVCIRLAAQKPEVQRYTNNTREGIGGITAHFIREGGRKKSLRIMWLLHNAVQLEMLSQNRAKHTNEMKARNTADKLPGYYKVFHSNMHHGKYNRPGCVIDSSHYNMSILLL